MADGGKRTQTRGRELVASPPGRPSLLPLVRAGAPSPVRRFARRFARFAGRLIIALALILILGFIGLYVRLSYAPISMTYLVQPIERVVNRSLTGMRFDIGDAVLRSSPTGFGIEFRLADVSLVDDAGNRIVESPMASADVSFRALLSGHLAVGEVELIGPRLFLQYAEDKGLALSFGDPRESKTDLGAVKPLAQPSGENGQEAEQVTRAPAVKAGVETQKPSGEPPQPGFNPHAKVRAINLSKAFNDLFSLMRRGESAYLTSLGIRDATVYFDRGDKVTTWEIPAIQVDLEHAGKNSAVLGHLAVKTPSGEWRMQFHASQNRHDQQLSIDLTVNDVVPHAIATEFPSLSLPKALNMPVSLRADLELGSTGDILSADIQTVLKAGEFYAPWDQKHPAMIDRGQFRVTYSREAGRIDFKPLEIRWGNSLLSMSGAMERQPATGHWAFRLASDKIAMGAEEFGVPVIPLDRLLIQGDFDPKQGITTLDRVFLQAADAKINLAGVIAQGAKSPAIRFTGQISPMPVAFVKLIWPPFISNGAREWIGKRVPAGRIAGGVVRVDIPADMLANVPEGGMIPQGAVDIRLDLEDLEIHYLGELPPMRTARASASILGQRFFFTVPEADIALPSGDKVHFTDGEFIVGDLRPHYPNGEIHFKAQSTTKAALELLDQPPLNYIGALNMKVPDIAGTATSTFSIALPLIKTVKFKDLKLNGRTHVDDIRATNLPGGFSIHGGKADFDTSEKALEAHGEFKANGLPVAIAWQRIFDATPEQQPPLRVRTLLDEAARNELGLEVNHIVRGAVPAEVTISMRKDQPPLVHLEANLSDVDILMSSMGWRKPPGQRAVLNLDVEAASDGGTVLRNINILGDDLAIRGELVMNDKRKPVSFAFPSVALNAQTKMELHGDLGANNIWNVHASGPSYDGRQFFRSLFSAGRLTDDQPLPPKNDPGMDIRVDIENVTGFFETSATNISVEAKRRNNKLVYLDMHGRLNKDDLIAARVEAKEGDVRYLLAESMDAGGAFRLVGFYPSAYGGQASLKVNLDGAGPVEKVGVLYAHNFVVVNNEVIGEVLSAAKKDAKKGERTRAVPAPTQQNYERIYFDKMLIPFSVGSGQFILHDGLLNGPEMGVTMRGSIDFKRERINLSGTYTPAYGLTNVLKGVPLFDQLLNSREGEGVFGVTFGVEGSLANPDVQVNILAIGFPGVFRQLMEFDQPVPHIIPQEKRKPEQKSEQNVPQEKRKPEQKSEQEKRKPEQKTEQNDPRASSQQPATQ